MKSESTKDILTAGVRDPIPSATSCSHLILKAYKLRLYPNAEQREFLAKHFGCCRFVYNHYLAERKSAYEKDKTSLGFYANEHSLALLKKTEEFAWLGEVYSHALQASLKNLDCAYQKFFKKQNKFPKFHSKHGKQSCTFPDNVTIIDGKLKLPKFKTSLRMRGERPIVGRIHRATVSQTATGKYFVSLLCEAEAEIYEPNGKSTGIDLGIKDLAVCSDGERIANPRFLERSEKHLNYLQRQVSRKTKGSNNRRRARLKLSRFHERVANRRKDYIHKFTTRIVRENQTVCVEDLNAKGMESNHHLAKRVVSASFGEIVRQLEYKCKWHGREFVKVGRWFPSSKTCNRCGHKYSELTLKDREWTCPNCGAVIDRDYNAALNIRDEGMRILSGGGSPSDVKQKRAEAAA